MVPPQLVFAVAVLVLELAVMGCFVFDHAALRAPAGDLPLRDGPPRQLVVMSSAKTDDRIRTPVFVRCACMRI